MRLNLSKKFLFSLLISFNIFVPAEAQQSCKQNVLKSINQLATTMVEDVCKCEVPAPTQCGQVPANCLPESKPQTASLLKNQIPEPMGTDRENYFSKQILAGNFPPAMKNLQRVDIKGSGANANIQVSIFTLPDYVAIGSDQDYLRTPLTPAMAQRLADTFGMVMPSSKIVDEIYQAAPVKIKAYPAGPPYNHEMAYTNRFWTIDEKIKADLVAQKLKPDYGKFIAGHKKDVVIGAGANKVRIYGWAKDPKNSTLANNRIQPEGDPHDASHADYSHGIRFVSQWIYVTKDGKCEPMQMNKALMDPTLCPLVSKRCPMTQEFLRATH